MRTLSCAARRVQVIEKAYKKLRLDALVIQQGRLTQTAAKVGKDDLLSMVKYGAEQVFSSEPAKITDEDIDAIISKGESETVRPSRHPVHVVGVVSAISGVSAEGL